MLKRLLIAGVLIVLGSVCCGQVVMKKNLPIITGWKDTGHYIEQVREGKKNVLYAVDVTTGERTPYTPVARKAAATVKVLDGEVVYIAPDGSRKQLTRTAAEEKIPYFRRTGNGSLLPGTTTCTRLR